jgi:hypothetical protein
VITLPASGPRLDLSSADVCIVIQTRSSQTLPVIDATALARKCSRSALFVVDECCLTHFHERACGPENSRLYIRSRGLVCPHHPRPLSQRFGGFQCRLTHVTVISWRRARDAKILAVSPASADTS